MNSRVVIGNRGRALRKPRGGNSSDKGEHQLALDIEKAVVVPVKGIGIAGGKHADQPQGQDHHEDDEKRHVESVGHSEEARR